METRIKLRPRKISEAEQLRSAISYERSTQAKLMSVTHAAFTDAWEWGAAEKEDPSEDPKAHRDDMFGYWYSDRVNDVFR